MGATQHQHWKWEKAHHDISSDGVVLARTHGLDMLQLVITDVDKHIVQVAAKASPNLDEWQNQQARPCQLKRQADTWNRLQIADSRLSQEKGSNSLVWTGSLTGTLGGAARRDCSSAQDNTPRYHHRFDQLLAKATALTCRHHSLDELLHRYTAATNGIEAAAGMRDPRAISAAS